MISHDSHQELMVMGCDFLAKRPGLVEAAPGRYDRGIVGVAQVQHPYSILQ